MKYLNGGKKGIAEDNKDLQYHELSEGVAFINALRYNESGDAAITDAQVDQALLYVWGADQDLTKSTAAELNKAIDLLAGIYGWESIKGDF
ncbi:MAG: DUF4856 domain-containing protein [Cytophagales bacterium]|nr:DUF4856 domain-containing protein [Cytophagales bacterium]